MERDRVSVACVLAAAAGAGLLFGPVFGPAAVLLPVAAVAAVAFGAVELSKRVPALTAWRPVLVLVGGLLAVIETTLADTTLAGLPTGETMRALVDGMAHSWQLTLQSTWPMRPDLMVFVPLAVVLACVLGVELLHWVRAPLVALLPSLAVAGLSQAYSALTGPVAVAAALGFAVVAGALIWTGRRMVLLLPAVLCVAGAVALTVADPADRQPYSLRQTAPLDAAPVAGPLTGIAARLANPAVPVFSYRGDPRVDRWSLAVLDRFDGVNWSADGVLRRMGTELTPRVTVPTTSRTATVKVDGQTGPWLPSQDWPATVTGVEPLVDEARGSLVNPAPGRAEYTITWREPQAPSLVDLAIDPDAPGGLGSVGEVPPGIAELAERAAGGVRPSFQAALALERFLSTNYQVAKEPGLPTGHGWPQLRRFLLDERRGTSEQFAAAYVALARIKGIPARLVVGYRAPAAPSADGTYVVHNGDVLAWPEVAVRGVGWVPLDPTGSARPSGAGGLAAAAAAARTELPKTDQLKDPVAPPGEPAEDETSDDTWNWPVTLAAGAAGLGGLLAVWLLGVPLVTTLRAGRRRRRTGPAAVFGAWAEARDRLRAHGVPITPGMTVRDLARSAHPSVDMSTVDGLAALAVTVDTALWSGVPATQALADEAWSAVRTVRKGLARRPIRARLRAAVDARVLLRP
ncbi:transglutaminase domain-containing protein [Amycolatopsis sp. NPDC059657]|uniref:transglutaminase family protein n=1 Tax=Amycolatopsis sp. NPDC059657 TaxID=3346899 RepID=UPI00366D1A87